MGERVSGMGKRVSGMGKRVSGMGERIRHSTGISDVIVAGLVTS